MGWANASNVVTTNLDDATDSPASARADIKTAFDELSNVINGRNTASGVAGLDASSKICLLYTSPSPRDLSTSRMPSSA